MKNKICENCKSFCKQKIVRIHDEYPIDIYKVKFLAKRYECQNCKFKYEDETLKDYNRTKAIEASVKAEYRRLTDYAKARIGELQWAILGNLYRKYKTPFIKSCIDKFPEYKTTMSPEEKVIYLAGICSKNSTAEDVKNPNIKINIKGFRV